MKRIMTTWKVILPSQPRLLRSTEGALFNSPGWSEAEPQVGNPVLSFDTCHLPFDNVSPLSLFYSLSGKASRAIRFCRDTRYSRISSAEAPPGTKASSPIVISDSTQAI